MRRFTVLAQCLLHYKLLLLLSILAFNVASRAENVEIK